MLIPNGCISLARQIQQSKVWQNKPSWWLKAWLYIVMEAAHKNNGKFKRGTLFTSTRRIWTDCCLANEGISMKSVGNFLLWAKMQEQIKTQKTTRGIIIEVCNYEKFQVLNNYKKSTEKSTEKEIRKQSISNRQSTINNNVLMKECNNDIVNKIKEVYLRKFPNEYGVNGISKIHDVIVENLKVYTEEEMLVFIDTCPIKKPKPWEIFKKHDKAESLEEVLSTSELAKRGEL